MLSSAFFLNRILEIEKIYKNEILFLQSFFETKDDLLQSLDSIFNKLKDEKITENNKERTILLLKLYLYWYQKNEVFYEHFHQQFLYEMSYEIFQLFREEFSFQDNGTIFFEIIESLKNNNFFDWFRLNSSLQNPYETAYDILSFSKENPSCNTLAINTLNSVQTKVRSKGNGKNNTIILEIFPMDSLYFFSRIELKLNDEGICEDNILVFHHTDEERSHPPSPFTQKVKLLDKYLHAIMVDIMFQMEFNKGFWGIKNFLYFRSFLQTIISYPKNKNK